MIEIIDRAIVKRERPFICKCGTVVSRLTHHRYWEVIGRTDRTRASAALDFCSELCARRHIDDVLRLLYRADTLSEGTSQLSGQFEQWKARHRRDIHVTYAKEDDEL